MFIEFGDRYGINCFVEDRKPYIKLEGTYNTINYSSSTNEEKTYLNQGFLAFKFLDFKSNIVIKNYFKLTSKNGNEVLISFKDNCDREIFIYFNLETGDVGYDVS